MRRRLGDINLLGEAQGDVSLTFATDHIPIGGGHLEEGSSMGNDEKFQAEEAARFNQEWRNFVEAGAESEAKGRYSSVEEPLHVVIDHDRFVAEGNAGCEQ